MSSHQGLYYYSDTSPSYRERGSEPSVPQQRRYPDQSWPAPATADDQSGYVQQQSTDPVGNVLKAHDAEDMNYPSNHPVPDYPLPGTSLHDSGIVNDATYTNDDILFQTFANLPFHLEDSQNHYGYDHYAPVFRQYPNEPSVRGVHQMSGNFEGPFSMDYPRIIHTSQASQVPSPVYPYLPSTQLLSPSPVSQTNIRSVWLAADSLTQEVVDTARVELPNAGTGQHSHSSSVVTSTSNQTAAPGPSRPLPSSPERKRLLPLSADDRSQTVRRVMPRHDRAGSMHPASSDSHSRSRSNPDICERGPLIPQERYTTSSISTYNTPDRHPSITFDLENPDQTGVPIADILNKADSFSRIRDRTRAFNHMGKKTFTLRVQWPGYKPWSKTIAALDWTKTRAPITRVKLAEAVATGVRDLMEKYRNESYDPDYAEWNVGPNSIQFHQICLVALHHVSRGSWQPELRLLEPRR